MAALLAGFLVVLLDSIIVEMVIRAKDLRDVVQRGATDRVRLAPAKVIHSRCGWNDWTQDFSEKGHESSRIIGRKGCEPISVSLLPGTKPALPGTT